MKETKGRERRNTGKTNKILHKQRDLRMYSKVLVSFTSSLGDVIF